MSWIDKVSTDFIITTGDGKQFKPMWILSPKSFEFNIAEFEFPDQPGSLVSRTEKKGTRHTFEIIFQGDNHLDDALAFEKSSVDTRAWTISHPLYGALIVQPTSLTFDSTGYNVSKITGTFIETITEDRPKITIDPQSKVSEDKDNLDAVTEGNFNIVPDTNDVSFMTSNNSKIYNAGKKSFLSSIDTEAYFGLFNAANTAVLNATIKPLEALRAMDAMINYPALVETSIITRINSFTAQLAALRAELPTIKKRSQKVVFQSNSATIISAHCLAATNPLVTDYKSKNDVLNIAAIITTNFNNFVNDLDSLQGTNGGNPDSFIPDSDIIQGLTQLVNFTISNLFSISSGAKQERTIYLEKDFNVIMLAHRLYGLLSDDSTIDQVMNENNIGISEVLNIKKGREILYYI